MFAVKIPQTPFLKGKFEMDINLRLERQEDYFAVENLTRDAFWGFTRPTCDEHYLAHILRKSKEFIPELDFVAEIDGELAGNIMYSKAKVVDGTGAEHEVITFGPLSVLPKFQSAGVGAALMRHTIMHAAQLGYKAIIFYGHPDYYARFGFQSAKLFDVTTPDGSNFDAFMAMELYPSALEGISGEFYEASLFNINEEDVQKFDLNFPPKKPAEMISIEVLLKKLPEVAQKAFRDKKITALVWLNRFSGGEILSWNGIEEEEFKIINSTLREHKFPEKLRPNCDIPERAKSGIKVLERR